MATSFLSFLLTRLLRGVTFALQRQACAQQFLLTRLLRGVTSTVRTASWPRLFLLTRLLRGVTSWPAAFNIACVFLLTRLLRGVTATLRVIERSRLLYVRGGLYKRSIIYCTFNV